MKREKWTHPKLIVLMRGKPDEMVLSACKRGGLYLGANTVDGACSGYECYDPGCYERTDS